MGKYIVLRNVYITINKDTYYAKDSCIITYTLIQNRQHNIKTLSLVKIKK